MEPRRRDASLDYAERWLRDGLDVLRPALMLSQVTVDMTAALGRLDQLRARGVQATSTHLLVHAVARALADNPRLHQMIAGSRRHWPERVDVGLSITGDTFIDPVLVIEDAGSKSVEVLVEETSRRAPLVRHADAQMRARLRRWGWLVPFGVLRRAVLRTLFNSPRFRRMGAGTFQISTVPVDWAAGATFSALGLLVAGQVRSRVVPVEGVPGLRPQMTLTLCGDHGVWDGRAASRFLSAVRDELEG